MNVPTPEGIRVEKVIDECMVRSGKRPQIGMQLAYRRVFIDALRYTPKQEFSEDPLHVAITVRALEYASFAAWVEHGTGDRVLFKGGAAIEVLDWLVEFRRFLKDLTFQWGELEMDIQRAEDRFALLTPHVQWISKVIERVRSRVEDSMRKPVANLQTKWFGQVRAICLEVAGYWMGDEMYAEFQKRLWRDSQELSKFSSLYNQPGKKDERST